MNGSVDATALPRYRGAALRKRMEAELPYTKEQRALFNAAAHDPEIAREHGMSGREAGRLADEANRLKRQGREKKAGAALKASLPSDVIDLEPVFGRRADGQG